MKTIVTHSGGFHTDDVFAVAALQLVHGKENILVTRTRDDSVIAAGDIVVDVGGEYSHEKQRYDHHQGDAPVRDNGIPYAAIGLVWKHYGEEICGSEKIADAIDGHLIQPIDAGDNGVSLYTKNTADVSPFELYNITNTFRSVSNDASEMDKGFLEAVDFARGLLKRTIAHTKEHFRKDELAQAVYEAAEDKTVLVFDEQVDRHTAIQFPEPLAIVYPSDDAERGRVWKVGVVPTGKAVFEDRAKFPKEWGGLRDEELAKVSGIPDAVFCHKASWRFVAVSKESAIKAAKLAK